MLLSRFFSAEDRGVYVICGLAGYALFLALRPAFWAPYVAMLTTYHLFLAYRIYISDTRAARSYSLRVTIAAHVGFVLLLVGIRLAWVASIRSFLSTQPPEDVAMESVFASRIIRLAMIFVIYGLVVLERSKFFGGAQKKTAADASDSEAMQVERAARRSWKGARLAPATDTDHELWVQYCARRKSIYYDPRKSPREDFERWLRARGKTQNPAT
jgi:hypothetical protein